MLTLGDIKPDSLRRIETLIWQQLILVSRRSITAETMVDRVLASIVPPHILSNFRPQGAKFKQDVRKYFAESFDELNDHTSFFFPGRLFRL